MSRPKSMKRNIDSFCAADTKSERRIINNQLKRKKEMQRNISLAILSICLAIAASLCCNGLLSTAEASESAAMEKKYYTSILIENGDTLWEFAEENMGSHYETEAAYIQEVMRINSLKEEKIIAGQHLVIPYFCAVKAEE